MLKFYLRYFLEFTAEVNWSNSLWWYITDKAGVRHYQFVSFSAICIEDLAGINIVLGPLNIKFTTVFISDLLLWMLSR